MPPLRAPGWSALAAPGEHGAARATTVAAVVGAMPTVIALGGAVARGVFAPLLGAFLSDSTGER
ncbi:hypothetical protein ACWD04_12895 [Streptomyces sp. NPDC002911]